MSTRCSGRRAATWRRRCRSSPAKCHRRRSRHLQEFATKTRQSKEEELKLRREQGQQLAGIIAYGMQLPDDQYAAEYPKLAAAAKEINPSLQLPDGVLPKGAPPFHRPRADDAGDAVCGRGRAAQEGRRDARAGKLRRGAAGKESQERRGRVAVRRTDAGRDEEPDGVGCAPQLPEEPHLSRNLRADPCAVVEERTRRPLAAWE
jgi:hypothetical protein